MKKIYRVTQYEEDYLGWVYVHSKSYRWKWYAYAVAWVMSGSGLRGARYQAEVTEDYV